MVGRLDGQSWQRSPVGHPGTVEGDSAVVRGGRGTRRHRGIGNRAEGRRVYERCRTLLREEVGLDPSPQLEALYQTLLHQPSSVNQGC